MNGSNPQQHTGSFLVDVVKTPFVNYMVVSYKDPHIAQNPECAGGVFDFSGDYLFHTSPKNGDLESHIARLVQRHPDLDITAKQSVAHMLDMPGGKLGYLLSQECIERVAEEFRGKQIAFIDKIKRIGAITGDAPSIDECYEIVNRVFRSAAWEQLVRRASSNYLQFDHSHPPSNLIYDEAGRGFAIVDCGTGSNCGFGVGTVFFYEALKPGADETSIEGVFTKETIEARYLLDTSIQALPPSAHKPEKIAELKTRGRVILFGDWLTFVKLDGPQLEALSRLQLTLRDHVE